jgi:cytoskeletal protein CcmA (bactofilin family)
MKKRWVIVGMLVLMMTAGLVGTAQAFVVNRDGNIPAGQTVDDDLILEASTVQMDGTVNGTLIAGGLTVTVNGVVKGDAILAGQTVVIGEKATIEGNLFAGAAEIIVHGKVNGSIFGGSATLSMTETAAVGYNLYYAGYDLETKPGARINKDISAVTYQSVLGGECRDLDLSSAAVELNGMIDGNARVRVAEPGQYPAQWQGFVPGFGINIPPALPSGLRVANSARIAGTLTYISPINQSSTIQAVPGQGVIYQTPQPQERIEVGKPQQPAPPDFFALTAGFWLWSLLRDMVTLILLGGLATWLINGIFQRVVAAIHQKPIQSAGIGLLAIVLAFFAFPICAVALVLLALFFGLLTLSDVAGIIMGVGFGVLALAAIAFGIVLIWSGRLAVSYLIGQWILRKLNSPVAGSRFWPLALGAILLAILTAIPFLGWIIWFVIALVGLGGIWYTWRTSVSTK